MGEMWEAAMKVFPARASPRRGDLLSEKWVRVAPEEAS